MWAVFVWLALPPAALLVAMLVSGQAVAMSTASKVLSTPVRLGAFQLSVAAFMAALCGILAVLSYAGMSRHEARLADFKGLATQAMYLDREERDTFFWGRNYYMCLLGLVLWVVAGRLKVLYDMQQIVPHKAARPVSRLSRVFYLTASILALLAADVPLCRVNYNMQLYTRVTPQKTRLQHNMGPCQASMLATADGPCAEWCAEVKKLSHERLATIQWARNWHVLGRWAAKLFDDARSVEQGDARIAELFRKRTCEQVLKGVDKSNFLVNVICFVLAFVSVIGAFSALSNAYAGNWYGTWGGADLYDAPHQD